MRRERPAGKWAGSVQVQVGAPPEVVGAAAVRSFSARQYAPTLTAASIQTSPSDRAWAALPVTTETSIGAYQLLLVGAMVWISMMSHRPAASAPSIWALKLSTVSPSV